MSRSITCLISGKKFTFSNDYFNKRVEEYGDVDSLRKYFVTKKVHSLIRRGYSVQEIRNILSIDSADLIDSDAQCIKDIVTYHTLKVESVAKRTSCNFANYKSDEDVTVFINNIKNLNYD